MKMHTGSLITLMRASIEISPGMPHRQDNGNMAATKRGMRTVGLTKRAVKVCKSAACAGENEYDERTGKGRQGCTEQRSDSVTGLDSEEMRGK